MMDKGMVRKQLYLPAEQEMALKRRATEERTSEAEVVRKALGLYLARRPRGRRNPLRELVGAVRLGDQHASERHDDAIY